MIIPRTLHRFITSKTISPMVLLSLFLISFLTPMNESICFAADLVQARKLLLTGKLEEAKDEYQEILKDPKTAHAATIGLSKICEAQGDLNAALKIISDLKNPSADVLGRKAEIQFLMGLWNDAEASAANALVQNPDHLQARWVKARILWEGGEIPKALSEFQWFVKSYSDKLETPNAYKKPEDLLIIALASLENARWYALGDELETILNDLLKDTLKIDPDFWPAEALAGKILLEKHNRPEALAAFSKVLAINPEAPEALVGKGEAAIQKMEYQEAE
ncbi:MAG: tetratricopeptide repeat protein, partial [Planctomycetota bacterium]